MGALAAAAVCVCARVRGCVFRAGWWPTDNLLLDRRGRLRIGDLGLSELCPDGASGIARCERRLVVGTADYWQALHAPRRPACLVSLCRRGSARCCPSLRSALSQGRVVSEGTGGGWWRFTLCWFLFEAA
eukprot:COSAG01_NODE_13456_length_1583_cov_1.685310_2_plen_130_part_00